MLGIEGRNMANKKITLTKEAREELNQEYRHLIDVERPDVIEKLQLARSQGDLSENADYDAARDRQSQIEARITELERIFQNSVDADESVVSDKVGIGSIVEFKNVSDNESNRIKIIGNIGADPMAETPTVSNESPLGRALLGHNVGDKVSIACEEPYIVEITDISK